MGREHSAEGRNAGPGRAGGASREGGRGGRRGGKMGIESGKMQHSVSPTDSTLDHMGGARNTGPGRETKYDPDGKAAAIKEARRQRPTNDLVTKALQALGQVVPGPFSTGVGIGNAMAADVEDEAPANIDKLKTNPDDPGAIAYTKDGALYSNRAGFPGSDLDKRDKAIGARGGGSELGLASEAEERRRRRTVAQKTALGSVFDQLGPGVLPI